MEPKKSKYDTNPLDPDFVKNTEEVWGESGSGPETQEVRGATREIGSSANENARSNIYSEAPTRRYDNVPLDSPYPSIFVPPTYSQPAPYQPPPAPYRPNDQRPTAAIGSRHRLAGKVGHDTCPTLPSTSAWLFRCLSCSWCRGRNRGCVFMQRRDWPFT